MTDRLYFRQLLSGRDFATGDMFAQQMRNFAYLIGDSETGDCVVVDPAYAAGDLVDALEADGMHLSGVLVTHHHPDHVGGNEGLLAQFGAMPVYAHASDEGRIPGQTERVEEGRRVRVAGLDLEPIHVPGHTTGAVAYVVDQFKSNRVLRRYLRSAFLVEELYIPTLMMSSPFSKKVACADVTYTKFTPAYGPHPKILTATDFDALMASPKLFGRKVDSAVDVSILDMLDKSLGELGPSKA